MMSDAKTQTRKLNVFKRDDGIDYFADFLDLIKLPLARLSEVIKTSPPRFAIRHDVDHDIDAALLVAEAEAHRGYKSTYFLLTPGSYGEETNYYGTIKDGVITHDAQLIEKCRRFIELGHDIGFHNDVISLALRFRKQPADILRREVDFFAENDIPLAGTAAHGSFWANELDYANMEIFEGCRRKERQYGREIVLEGWKVMLHSLKLIDYGFHYEVYSLPKDAYISDSGSQWGGKINDAKIKSDLAGSSFSKEIFRTKISELVHEKVHSLQILMHPCHWDVYTEGGQKISVVKRSVPMLVEPPDLTSNGSMRSSLRKLKVIKRDDGINYFDDYLELIGLPLVHISELSKRIPPRYFIRHDVDHDIDTALLVAEAEARYGYKSTYFLLTPGSYGEKSNYYGALEDGSIKHQPDLIEKCKRFIDLGHEIGLHNDILSLSLILQKSPEELLRREVDYFAANGVAFAGTAAHGNPLARELKYSNYEIFSNCIRKNMTADQIGRVIEYRGWRVKLHTLRLADFGFKYEVYFAYRNADIADSGSRWLAELMKGAPKGVLNGSMTTQEFRDRLSAFLNQPMVTSLQVLHHPCHWDVYNEQGDKISAVVRSRPGSVVNKLGMQLKAVTGELLKADEIIRAALIQKKQEKGEPGESLENVKCGNVLHTGKPGISTYTVSSTWGRGTFSRILNWLRIILGRRHE